MSFQPTQDQEKALKAVLEWFKEKDNAYFTLGGYAGTGKTTLIGEIRNLIHEKDSKLKVAFCAFTGKASQVLKKKLHEADALYDGDSVSTIHGLIYEAIIDEDGRLIDWKRRKKIPADLIVLDEASMVGREIFKDLLSHRIPILAVGDHGQLPPVNDDFSLMLKPDARLEQIHRQAQDSPIIQLSMEIRNRGRIPYGSFGRGVAKLRQDEFDLQETTEAWSTDCLFLAGKNTTRVNLNRKIREIKGIENSEPIVGDRVICLRNNWEKRIFNGQLGTIEQISSVSDSKGEFHWFKLQVELDEAHRYSGNVSMHQFNHPSTITEFKGLRTAEIGDRFDFGYALTVHKAQGSQAKRIVVFEERIARDEDTWRRWLYTAVTRAEEELIIVGPPEHRENLGH